MAKRIEKLELQRVNGHIEIPGYKRKSGEPLKGDLTIEAAHIHMKQKPDDGLRPPEEYPYRALERGISGLIPSGHNDLRGFDRMLREVANRDLPIVLTPAFEYEARENGKPKHVLALNALSVPEPGLTVIEANKAIHAQGDDAVSIAPHAGLANYSVDLSEVAYIQMNGFDRDEKFDGIEYNAASEVAYRFGRRLLVRPLVSFVPELPKTDLNREVDTFITQNATSVTLFRFGGSDAHFGDDFDDVVMVRPANKTITEALRANEVIIYMKEKLKTPYWAYIRKHIYIHTGI